MEQVLLRSELFEGLNPDGFPQLLAISESQSLNAGEYLFLLGDSASRLFVVIEGQVDLCFPFSLHGEMRDIAVESKPAGSALGWSAFVKPHRFRLSARAAEPSVVAAFSRSDVEQLMAQDCRLGLSFATRIAEIVAARLLKIQALWARELQRSLPRTTSGPLAGTSNQRQDEGGYGR